MKYDCCYYFLELFYFLNFSILLMMLCSMAKLGSMQSNVVMQEFLLGIGYLSAGLLMLASRDFNCIFTIFWWCACDSLYRFVPPEIFDLALLTLELEFVKKGTKEEHVCSPSRIYFYALSAQFFYVLSCQRIIWLPDYIGRFF